MTSKARMFLDSRCLRLGDDWDRQLASAQRASLVTVFVGDHFNDETAMLAAALSIAYPPHDQVSEGVATAAIHEDDLSTLLPRILVA